VSIRLEPAAEKLEVGAGEEGKEGEVGEGEEGAERHDVFLVLSSF
jgi:hypothetical protein